ncbi:MAG: hypothetical protein NVV82_00620 [Sporocytophaga sp.]|nr:hypothetical protein [Sporocytophaga sp.]
MFSNPALVKILATSSIAVVLIIVCQFYLRTYNLRSFNSLTQKKKVALFLITLLLVGVLPLAYLTFSFINQYNSSANSKSGPFWYGGYIVDEFNHPLANSYAYIIIGTDTIKQIQTGSDGVFKLRIDTVEGISTTVYFGHPQYEEDRTFRILNPSTTEKFVLKKKELKTPKVFSLNSSNASIIKKLEMATGFGYNPLSKDLNISICYDTTGFERFESRCRYLGGKVLVMINGRLCCRSNRDIEASNAVGYSNIDMLKKQLSKKIEVIVEAEKRSVG